jgi:hypothetical protein
MYIRRSVDLLGSLSILHQSPVNAQFCFASSEKWRDFLGVWRSQRSSQVKLNIEHALLDSMLLTGRGRRVFSCNYRLAGTDFQLNRPEILSYRRDYLLLLSDGSSRVNWSGVQGPEQVASSFSLPCSFSGYIYSWLLCMCRTGCTCSPCSLNIF